MSLICYSGTNPYLKKLNEKYYNIISSLDHTERGIIYDIAKLSYKAGIEEGKRKIKGSIKTKMEYNDDSEDSEDDD